jgi:hypothetical protein
MTIEAEAGGALTKWSESTAVKSALAGASGGFVIDRIGEWGSPDGYLEVTVTVPEAGTYRLAVSYLFLASNFESTRRARITITYPAGASPAVDAAARRDVQSGHDLLRGAEYRRRAGERNEQDQIHASHRPFARDRQNSDQPALTGTPRPTRQFLSEDAARVAAAFVTW